MFLSAHFKRAAGGKCGHELLVGAGRRRLCVIEDSGWWIGVEEFGSG